MRKILSNNPWVFVIGFFIAFVMLWIGFINFAVKHQPQQVPLVERPAIQTDGSD